MKHRPRDPSPPTGASDRDGDAGDAENSQTTEPRDSNPDAVADVQADGTPADAPGTPSNDGPLATGTPGSELERQLADQRDRYLRLAAEYDNFRKRSQRERSEAASRGQAELVRQLLDALDDLGRFAHVDPASTDATTIVQGVDMVEKKMLKVLSAAGLEVVNPVDQTFDPAVHEAVATEPALSREDDHVVSRVYQQGYVFNGQLLRPARVVVKQWNG